MREVVENRMVVAGDYIDIRDGTHDSPQKVAVGIPLITSKNLVSGQIDFSNAYNISHEDHNKISCRSAVRKDDILMPMIGTIGNPVIVETVKPFSIKNVALFRSENSPFSPRYLLHILKSTLVQNQLDLSSRGGTQKFVSLNIIRKLKVPLPPLPEQKRIAAILDKADEIKRKREEAIKLCDEFLKSVFLEMFGDPVTNPMGWEMVKLSDLGQLDRGKSKHRPRNAPELLGGPYPLIQTGDVANSKRYIYSYKSTYSEVGLKQSKLWPTETLCITIAANIAKVAILKFEACFPDSIVGFTPIKNKVVPEYILYCFSFFQKLLEDSAPESAQKNINLAILRELKFPLPPLNQQNKFKSMVTKLETLGSLTQNNFKDISDLQKSISYSTLHSN